MLIRRVVPLVLALSLGAFVTTARAAPCDSKAPERYRSAKTIWCVNPDIWAGHQAEVEKFFPYGDQVVAKLEELFAITPPNLPFVIEAMEPNGYAMTPSHYGPGVAVTGDAFYNDFGGVAGYWGYLLVLHEFINQWTGLVTGGWPTDWWADHRSPFPNSMDEQIMRLLGLAAAANAQHRRFSERGSSDYDEEVVMFNEHFAAYGFEGLRRAFQLIQADDLSWFDLRDPPRYDQQSEFVSGNPSALLSSYVTAYLSLGAGADVTAKFLAANVGKKPPRWDGEWRDTSPTTDAVTAIANAHCSIAAAGTGANVTAARAALRKGDYARALLPAPSNCAQSCPAQCACKAGTNECVAPWVVGRPAPEPGRDAGTSTPGDPDAGVPGGGETPSPGEATGGCGCRTPGSGSPSGVALLALAVLLVLRRRS